MIDINNLPTALTASYETMKQKVIDLIHSPEGVAYKKMKERFTYPEPIMEQLRPHIDPKYLAHEKIATKEVWKSQFGRAVKLKEKGIQVHDGSGSVAYFKLSQTTGSKQLPEIYKNLGNELEGDAADIDILTTAFSQVLELAVEEANSFPYIVVADDFAFDPNRKALLLRPNLGEQQKVLAFARAVATQRNHLPHILEPVAYLVCHSLGVNTDKFSIGYIAEQLTFLSAKLDDVSTRTHILNDAELILAELAVALEPMPADDETERTEVRTEESTALEPVPTDTTTNTSDGDSEQLAETTATADTESDPADDAPSESDTTTTTSGGNALDDDHKSLPAGQEEQAEPYTPQPPITPETIATTVTVVEEMNGKAVSFTQIVRRFDALMPDSTITQQEVHSTGYYSERMLPLRQATALELYRMGNPIYKLLSSNEEVEVISIGDIRKHRQFFGITEDDWASTKSTLFSELFDSVQKSLNNNKWEEIMGLTQAQAIKKEKALQVLASEQTTDPATGTATQEQPAEQAHPKSTAGKRVLTPDGSVGIVMDDLDLLLVQNETWLEDAIRAYLSEGGYTQKDIPFFEADQLLNEQLALRKEDYRKINEVMALYCLYHLNIAIKKHRTQLPDNGSKKPRYSYRIPEILTAIRGHYLDDHIKYVFAKLWGDVKASEGLKEKLVMELFKALSSKNGSEDAKKNTPEQSFIRAARINSKVKEQGGDEAEHQPQENEDIQELKHLIAVYKRNKEKQAAKATKEAGGVMDKLPDKLPTIKGRGR